MTDDPHAFRPTRRALLKGGVGIAGIAAMPAGALAPAELEPIVKKIPMRIYGDDAYPVWHRRSLPLDTPLARYPGFNPSIKLLKKGTIRREGALPLPCDIVFERDVALKLRDGTTIYTDVFRPVGNGRYPAVVAWSPYGKEIGGQWFDDVRDRSGVPLANVSELQKFEGPDPARFVERGYVVLNPDARGSGMSEGNISFFGRQLAEDGYDFVEWAAKQSWCDGKVAMAGNSWLAISQWFIAAERPPHLAAIAPWEGDRGGIARGGIPRADETVPRTFAGRGLQEDSARMALEFPLMNAYWRDKTARQERIQVPAYVVASYTHPGHTWGTFAGFRSMASKRKWLRIHNTNEWQDFNTPEHQADLIRFFDHVMKGQDNGWDKTPTVRLAVLDPGGTDTLDRPEKSFPLARQQFRKLFLAPDGALVTQPATAADSVVYPADKGMTRFRRVFDRDTEITGYMKLRLWVEARGANDMDIAIRVEKLDPSGNRYPGPPGAPMGMGISTTGQLRVSHRALDPAKSTESEPVLLHTSEQLLSPGEIVPIDIDIWPMAMRYRAGEMLSLMVTAMPTRPEFPWGFGETIIPVPRDGGTFVPGSKPDMILLGGPESSRPAFSRLQTAPLPKSRNSGQHVVYFGGRYDSHLLVPEIPV